MAARGMILSYEAVRYWCRKFGQAYANHQKALLFSPNSSGIRGMSSSRRLDRIKLLHVAYVCASPHPWRRTPLVAGAYNPGHARDAGLLAGTTSPAPRETASLACAVLPPHVPAIR